jgi:hypothetical protein
LGDEYIGEVDPGRSHLDDHLTAIGFEIRLLLDDEGGGTAKLLANDGAHGPTWRASR